MSSRGTETRVGLRTPSKVAGLAVALLLAIAAGLLTAPWPVTPSDSVTGTDAALADRVRALTAGSGRVGVSVAVIEHGRLRTAGLGDTGTGRPVTPDTAFEIGSVTKPFTASLFADLVAEGVVEPDDTVREVLPERDWQPGGGGDATLAELASQRSGLPRVPFTARTALGIAGSTFGGGEPAIGDPEEVISEAAAARRSDVGEYAYSNLGFAFLGHVLAEKVGRPYPDLLRERVLGPLRLAATSLPTSQDAVPADSVGHDRSGRVVPSDVSTGDIPAGAGVWSTPTDLAVFGQRVMDGDAPGHDAAEPRFPGGVGQIGYAWNTTRTPDGGAVVWHNGRSGGYTAFLGFDREEQRVVAVLNNSKAGVDEVGMELLSGTANGRDDAPRLVELVVGAGLPLAAGASLLAASLGGWYGRRRRTPDRAGLLGTVGWSVLVFAIGRAAGMVAPVAIAGWLIGAALAGAAIFVAAVRWRGLPWSGARRSRLQWAGTALAITAGLVATLLVIT